MADLNLYLIKRSGFIDYEEDESAIVAAESPNAARTVMTEWSRGRDGSAEDPKKWEYKETTVKLVGSAKQRRPGVVHVANRGM